MASWYYKKERKNNISLPLYFIELENSEVKKCWNEKLVSTIFFVTLAPRFWSLHFQNFATIVFFRVNDAIEKQLETGKVLSVDLAMVPGNLSRLPFYQEFKLITSLSEYLFGARTCDRFGSFPPKKKFKWKKSPWLGFELGYFRSTAKHLSTELQSHRYYWCANWFLYLASDLGPVLVDTCFNCQDLFLLKNDV